MSLKRQRANGAADDICNLAHELVIAESFLGKDAYRLGTTSRPSTYVSAAAVFEFRSMAVADTSPAAASGPTAILIVEDDALIRLTLSDHLQDAGFKILEAGTGDEALAIMVAPAFAVDMVITDVVMPGLTDGFALATWIKGNQPSVSVIVASGDPGQAALANDTDFQFVRKPYDLDKLTAQIHQTLRERKR